MLTVVSLFAGVGGFDLAFQRAGAKVVAAVEIDAPARAVLARRFPETALFNDVTKVSGDDLRAAGFVPERGIITGGFPCQDISIAGRRVGLAGERSGLFWEIVRLLDELHPAWVVLENVPNLLSINDGADMGAVVGALGELGYGFAYRVLDAQFFGVPQRRRRVFIVGHLGAPFGRAAEVLFESEGGGGDSPQGDQPWTNLAGGSADGVGVAGANGRVVSPLLSAYRGVPSTDESDQLVIMPALTARGGKGADSDANGVVTQCLTGQKTHTLTAEGADASEDGTGRGTPIVAVHENQRGELTVNDTAGTLNTGGGKPGQGYPTVAYDTIVRRLTPLECERLQGFPDDWTDGQSDAQRYRQMGNTLAVPVVEWIARRVVAA